MLHNNDDYASVFGLVQYYYGNEIKRVLYYLQLVFMDIS